jgi:hypothetical protein
VLSQTPRHYDYKLSKVPVLCDNESAIRMAENPVKHIRTKHIVICYHFLRDHSQRGDIVIDHVSTHKQLANIFTEPLDEKRFCEIRCELNVLDSQNLAWNITLMLIYYTFDHSCLFHLVQMHIFIFLVPRLRLMCFQVYFCT